MIDVKLKCTNCGELKSFGSLNEKDVIFQEKIKRLNITKEYFIENYKCKKCVKKKGSSTCMHSKGLVRELDGSLHCSICNELVVNEQKL